MNGKHITNVFHKIIDMISYKKRHEKLLLKINENAKRYTDMSETEFLLKYIEAKSRYENKKLMFTVVFVTVMLSTVTDAWKYLFNFLNRLLSATDPVIMEKSTEITILVIIIIISIVIFVILIMADMIKSLSRLNQQIIFLDEIKEIRKKGNE